MFLGAGWALAARRPKCEANSFLKDWSSLVCLHRCCGAFDGFDDPRIGAATTNVAVQGFDDFSISWARIVFQKSSRRHDHSGSAVAALHGVFLNESLLQIMQFAILSKAFDCSDLLLLDRRDLRYAAAGCNTAQHDSTGAALTFAAAIFGTGEA